MSDELDVQLARLAEELAALMGELDPHTAPIACFDADHTLWAGDVADIAYRALIADRALRPQARAAFAQLCAAEGFESSGDAHRDAEALYERCRANRIREETIILAMTVCFAGFTIPEVREYVRRRVLGELAPLVHYGIPELMARIRAQGIAVHVISGSPQLLVEEGVAALGVPAECVAGVVLEAGADGVLGTNVTRPITFRDGKCHAIERWIGARSALVAFGDSIGDLAMLERAHLRVAVNPRPAVLAEVDRRGRERWRLFYPARTVGGRAVHRHASDLMVSDA